jgi:uncharacterized protein
VQLIDGTLVYSASDLVTAAECEFAAARRIDETLGLVARAELPEDALMARAARMGDAFEARVIDGFVAEHGESTTGVVQMPRPAYGSLEALHSAQTATIAAVEAGAAVITQAVLFDGLLLGYADFLIRQPDGTYAVADAKLARSAKVRAVLQIAAYHDLAAKAGAHVSDTGYLLLGDGSTSAHHLPDVVHVVAERRAHLDDLIATRQAAEAPVAWREPSVNACGRCPVCQAEVAASRDVLAVAGLRMTQRTKLEKVGITTIDDLAAAAFRTAENPAVGTHDRPQGIAATTLAGLQGQARLQVAQMTAEEEHVARDGIPAAVPPVTFEVVDPAPLAAIPTPSPGDIYFDFEGDPLWQDPEGRFGLEYLFGVIETPTGLEPPAFVTFVAHSRAEEKQALVDFMEYVATRREQWPDMHVYHYANYEKAALLRLAASHGVCEDEVDDLLRANVLVDLYPLVTRAIRVSQPSYSLKKLEPLYMGDELRAGEVTNAGDSVVAYAEYCQARDGGQVEMADELLKAILDYNEYDCRSTLGLRRWLADRAAEHGVTPGVREVTDAGAGLSTSAAEEAALVEPLLRWAEAAPDTRRTPEQQAVALVAAAVGFHRREDKPYWWGHFDRLSADLEYLDGDRESMVVREARVLTGWHKPPRAQSLRRVLELVGDMPTGSDLERAKNARLLYASPHPVGLPSSGEPAARGWRDAKVDRAATRTDAEGRTVLQVTELLAKGAEAYEDLPVAVGPPPGPTAGSIRVALAEVAGQVNAGLTDAEPESVAAALPAPARDLLLRRPPRLRGLDALPAVVDGDFVTPMVQAVLALDGSTLSVQGPPGTGKTYVGSHVIARLVLEHGWRVGVVSQGHAVVNNMLDKVVEAGVPGERVGKKERPEASAWTNVADSKYAAFLAEHADVGCVLGGTAWDFTNLTRVQRGELDLLVVDEAGQYSLAMTLAASVSAQRLLLVGDPQQLPQVSQGSHPEPVDRSALGWLSEGQTLRAEFGYFLDRTWRMHPELTAKVSVHSYEGRLESRFPETTQRGMHDGAGQPVAPGVHTEVLAHTGNATRSPEEAARVVELAREALTWTWTPSAKDAPRPMRQDDVLVVAPYNAQVALLRASLEAAGLGGVRVGTVDKFQGQEAPVTLVSMTASAPADVPRGMDFLLSPNRVNVAVSRAQWRAVVVRSEALTDFLPTSPGGLGELGRFLGLVG